MSVCCILMSEKHCYMYIVCEVPYEYIDMNSDGNWPHLVAVEGS